MANRYWVGGTASWDNLALLKWSTTSGGTGGATVPSTGDTVFFDAASGANTITLGINPVIQGLGFANFTGTFAFGTQNISLNNVGTIFTGNGVMTVTGTPVINITNATSSAITLNISTAVTEANSISFNIFASSGPVTLSGSVKNLNFTGYTGALANSIRTIYGNLTLSTGMSLTAGANSTTFGATSGTQTITSNTKTMDFPITFAGTATYQLVDALTSGSSRTMTLTSGTLDLNNKTLTTGLFSSSNANTRSILFGTGNITLSGTGTVWTTSTITNFSYTGTPTVNLTDSSATARTVSQGAGTAAQAISVYIKAGTGTVSIGGSLGVYQNIDCTGSTVLLNVNGTIYIYGNLLITANTPANTAIIIFAGTSGTQIITSNGYTIDNPLTFSGSGTYQLIDALTVGSTRTVTLNSATLDLNNNTFTVGAFNSNNTNTRSILFGTGNITLTGSSGTLWTIITISGFSLTGTPTVNLTDTGAGTTRTITHTGGIASQAISVYVKAGGSTSTVSVGSTGAVFKTIDLTGFSGTFTNSTIYVTGDFVLAAGVTWTSTSSMNLIGTSTQNITSNGNTFDLPITVGQSLTTTGASGTGTTATITFASTTIYPSVGQTIIVRNVTPTGYNGTYTVTASSSTSVSYTNSTTGAQTVAGAINIPSNVQLVDAMTVGSTRLVSLGSGTFNTNAKSFTCGQFNANNSNTKTITLTNSTVTITNGSTTQGFYSSSTNTTFNLTGSNIVFTTSSVALYYIGTAAGFVPQVTMSGSGQLILGVSGGNSNITTLTNTVRPCTVSIVAGFGTLGVTNFNLSGTAGNLVTFNSTTAGTAQTISKTSGTVNAQYLSIQDSTATGGAKWYANSSNDLGNNTGWNIFNNSFLAVF